MNDACVRKSEAVGAKKIVEQPHTLCYHHVTRFLSTFTKNLKWFSGFCLCYFCTFSPNFSTICFSQFLPQFFYKIFTIFPFFSTKFSKILNNFFCNFYHNFFHNCFRNFSTISSQFLNRFCTNIFFIFKKLSGHIYTYPLPPCLASTVCLR